jgi:hypothetical protein
MAKTTLTDLRAAYEARSLKAGDIVRQLDLAGIALIWIFRIEANPAPAFDPRLLKAALLLFASLTFDLSQYLFGTILLFGYFRLKERQGTTDKMAFDLPAWLPMPGWICFWLKSALVLIAYLGFIMPFLVARFLLSQN